MDCCLSLPHLESAGVFGSSGLLPVSELWKKIVSQKEIFHNEGKTVFTFIRSFIFHICIQGYHSQEKHILHITHIPNFNK